MGSNRGNRGLVTEITHGVVNTLIYPGRTGKSGKARRVVGGDPVGLALVVGPQLDRKLTRLRDEAYTIIGEAADREETLNMVPHYRPHLLLIDYKMPGLGRLSAFCQEVGHRSPTTHTLILGGYAEEEIALEASLGVRHKDSRPLFSLFQSLEAEWHVAADSLEVGIRG